MTNKEREARLTERVSSVTDALGSLHAIVASVGLIVVWLVTGPIFRFSDTWQLIINTATTIITFNMVFIIQNTQNRDGRAIETKLDAILEALTDGDERLVGIEDLPAGEIKREQQRIRGRAAS